MTSGFTRKETLSLTGVSSGKLSYWDETELVKPEKFGNPKKPTVIYSWEQILQLKVIERLREKLSLQETRKIIEFLRKRNYKPSLFTSNLVFVDSQLYLIEDWEKFGLLVLEASGKNKGQIVIHDIGPIGQVFSELRKEAERHHVPDFEKRIKDTPLDALTPS
jgi:DNA-binding transcriptional MerR regulator